MLLATLLTGPPHSLNSPGTRPATPGHWHLPRRLGEASGPLSGDTERKFSAVFVNLAWGANNSKRLAKSEMETPDHKRRNHAQGKEHTMAFQMASKSANHTFQQPKSNNRCNAEVKPTPKYRWRHRQHRKARPAARRKSHARPPTRTSCMRFGLDRTHNAR